MELSKRNLIIVGGIILVLLLGIVILGRKPKTKPVVTNPTPGQDFNVVEKKDEVVVFNTPTPTPTLIPTKIPTSTPTLTPTLTPTPTPTSIPSPTPTARIIPTRRPTRVPTATPTPDNSIKATGVSLSTTELTLAINQTHQILSKVEPNDTTDKSVSWSSSDGNIATVDSNGNVTGKNLGETLITAKTSNGKTTIVRVTVINTSEPITQITSEPITQITSEPVVRISIYPQNIRLNYTTVNLKVGEKEQLRLDIKPVDVTDYSTRWSSSDSSVAIVSIWGMVTAKSPGNTIITAKTVNGLIETATITVAGGGVLPPNITPTPRPTQKLTPVPTTKPTATPTKKPTATPTQKPTATQTTVFLKDFEDGSMGGWVLNDQSFGKFEIANIGYNSKKSLMIESNQGYNKMDATYKINNLKPFSYYTLNVYIKTEGIRTKDGVIAASVVVRSWYVNKTEEENGDWKLYSMEFLSDESGEIDISCALGLHWFAGGVMGRAYFDNIQLIENFREVALIEGKHINLFLKKDYIKDIPNNTLTKLVSRLDSVYENYSDLVGLTPYQNKKIIVAPLLMNLHIGAAFAGNPISWITDSMKERLNQVNNNDDWCYILLHEISHDFDIDVWNFDAEVLAQIKTIYAVEKMNARIMPGDSYNYYVGSDVSQHYKYVYDDYNKRGFYFNEYMTYVLLKIKDNIGWDAFKQAFRNLNTLNVYVGSASERLNLFLNELSKVSNKDVKGMISNSDKKIIESQFGKVF